MAKEEMMSAILEDRKASSNPFGSLTNSHKFYLFIFVTLALSWSIWIPLIFVQPENSILYLLLFYLPTAFPSVIGILCSRFLDSKKFRDIFKDAFVAGATSIIWLFASIGSYIGLFFLACLLGNYFGISHFDLLKSLVALNSTGPIALTLILLVFCGPVSEEFGWRGFALKHLNSTLTFKTAVAILGFFWAIWHMPLFFLPTMQHAIFPFPTAMFFTWFATLLISCVFISWTYYKGRENILIPISLHFLNNLLGTLLIVSNNFDLRVCLLIIGLEIIVSGIVLIKDGGKYYNDFRMK